jgi:hypothetical protein
LQELFHIDVLSFQVGVVFFHQAWHVGVFVDYQLYPSGAFLSTPATPRFRPYAFAAQVLDLGS